MFPWACELLPPVFARCCRFSAPSDRRTSGSWQVPGLVPADGAGLQRHQDGPGRRRRARAPAGRLPQQLDGRRIRHSRRCCPTTLSSFNSPLSFFSKKLSPAETCYSTFNRELLAVYSATPLSPDAGRLPVFRPQRPQDSLPHLGPAFCSVVRPTAAAFCVHL